MNKDTLLSVDNLEVIYTNGRETVRAVNNISFDIKRKETLGLVGETGAGKTTTALSIMGLLPERTGKILSGSIELEDKDLLKLTEKEMQAVRGGRISMIFQDPMTSLNPVIPIGDQIEEALLLHNIENKSREELRHRVDEMLTLVGINPDRK